jgi:hypothetical protein
VDPTATNGLTLSLIQSSGEVLGSFVDPVSRDTETIHGVILQNTTNTCSGYFLGTSQGGSFILIGD